MIGSIIQDVRFCLRMLLKSPGFSVITILTLALGVSINSAVFSIVHAVLIRPLPVRNWERSVAIATVVQREALERRGTSYMDYLDWRAQSTVFEEMAALTEDSFTLTSLGQAEQVQAEAVSGSYFSLIGTKPVLGRMFLPQEERLPLSDPPALIGHSFWLRHFGREKSAIGKIIQLDDQNFRITGVLSENVSGMDGETEIWIPIAAYTLLGESKLVENRGTRQIDVFARLKPGVTKEQAAAEMSAIAQRLQKEYPVTNLYYNTTIIPLREEFFGETKPLLLTLLGAVLFVLLIACANVANLLVAKATARQKEMALRAALGAGKSRIMRQLLTESVMLSLIGGAFGWLLANVFVKLLITLNPVQLPAFVRVELNTPVLFFTLGICALSGILMGLAPAFHASRRDLQDAIKESAVNTTGASVGKDVRNFLVVSEVALAVSLLIGAGLLARSFQQIQNIPLGFVPDQRVAMRISLPRLKYEEEKAWQFSKVLLEKIESIPSVQSAALTSDIPLGGSASASILNLEGKVLDRGVRVYFHAVSPKFFSTTGIPLIAGRSFQSTDTTDSLPVAIVSEKMVQRYWSKENPIGKRVKFGRTPSAERPWMTIVGVAAEVKHRTIVEDPVGSPDDPEIYLPLSQRVTRGMGLIVRTEKDTDSISATLRKEIQSMDPDIPVFSITTMRELVQSGTSGSRFSAFLMIVFGALALMLSAIGIYGVLTFHVTQRTREIGVRLALGAPRLAVFNMILRHALVLTMIGLGLGLLAARGLSGLLSAQLYQISPTDPFIFSSIPLILLAVAFIAIVIPARRAMKVEPVIALRME
ncbi:ABC transporter permease [bacterium]|nr:ABC transporter permease [bacterium]